MILTELDINPLTLKTVKPRLKRTHYRAIINWLTKYKPKTNFSNFDRVKGLIETFYHLCQVRDWEKASDILAVQLNTTSKEQLHNELFIWSYYKEQIPLYKQLVGKINFIVDGNCFNALGNIHIALEELTPALEYYGKICSRH